jgi:hypothetical protein
VEDQVHGTHGDVGLDDALNPNFVEELPTKEEDTFDLTSDEGKNRENAKKRARRQ